MQKLLTHKKDLIIIFSLLLIIYVCHLIGYPVPCLFNKFTGLLCPGCGITGMCLNLMKFDFITAYKCNKYVFSLLVLVFIYILYALMCTILKKEIRKPHKHVYNLLLIATILYWILRNL